MRHGLLLAIVLVLVLVLRPPSPAVAGTAHVRETLNSAGGREAVLIFTAGPGERNEVVVNGAGDSATLVLRDAGTEVVAGPGCDPVDGHTVRCVQQPYVLHGVTLALLTSAVIDAGDGDDAVRTHSFSDSAFGGEGADTLTGSGTLSGGSGNDVLTSTSGPAEQCAKACGVPPDVLSGGPGDDFVRGGGGADFLSGDGDGLTLPDRGGGNDTIDGGGGNDSVSYAGRPASVRVDLSGESAGGAIGERDTITGVERVTGGDGADVLIGNEDDNSIYGGPGSDRVHGGGGDDTLDGGPGADTLRGDAGDDVLESDQRGDALYGGAGDDRMSDLMNRSLLRARTVDCGGGDDLVPAPHGQLLVGCEQADLGGLAVSVRPRRKPGGTLRFDRWSCSAPLRCEFTVTLRGHSVALARRRAKIPSGRTRALIVRPRRSTRPGDVIEVAVVRHAVFTDSGSGLPAIGPPALGGRWRVRL